MQLLKEREISESSCLPNYQTVSDSLFRGGQPSEEGFSLLKDRGIKTVINLREEASSIKAEAAICRSLGLDYVSIPLRPFDIPGDDKVDAFLNLCNLEDHKPIFVHCLHGMDRTGLMIGLYRMQSCDWSYEKTFEEMLKFGFHPAFKNLTSVLEKYALAWGKSSEKTCQEENSQESRLP